MQEWISVPVSRLHASASLTLEQLALIETLGIGYHAVERAGLTKGEWAVVVGAGPIGLATMQFASLAGVRLIAVDLSQPRLDFSRQLGVSHTVNAAEDPLQALESITGPELAHCVFDATGNLASMAASLHLAGPGGRVVMVGLAQGSFPVDDPLFHRRELTLLATRNSAGAFPALIRGMEAGEIDTSPWITHHLDLDALPEQFSRLYEPEIGLVKAMIEVR
jgi:threonine dehydrogenase-like Zn-dependent dehydrogenase